MDIHACIYIMYSTTHSTQGFQLIKVQLMPEGHREMRMQLMLTLLSIHRIGAF